MLKIIEQYGLLIVASALVLIWAFGTLVLKQTGEVHSFLIIGIIIFILSYIKRMDTS